MTDSSVGVKQSASADRQIDTTKIGAVERQRVQVGGDALGELAAVKATDPGAGAYGLVVRPLAPAGGFAVDVQNLPALLGENPQPDADAVAVRPIFPDYSTAWFGRQRVAVAKLLFDAVHRYALDAYQWDTATNAGGTVTHTPAVAAMAFSVPTTSGAYAKLRTHTVFRYQPGRSQRILITCWHADAGRSNQVRRWGYFDDADGVFFQLTNTTLALVRRTSTGVEASEETVAQSSWNVDPMTGSGPSGVTLDLTKANLFEIDIAWLGVGNVRVFVNRQLVHVFRNPNRIAGPYMRSGSLPLSYEVVNSGAAGSSGTAFYALCAAVFADGGWDELGPAFVYPRSAQKTGISSAAFVPVMSLRPSALFGGVTNRIALIPTLVHAANETNRAAIGLVLDATLTGATWAATPPSGSSVDVDEAATAYTGGTFVGTAFLPNTNDDGEINLADVFNYETRLLRRGAFNPGSVTNTITLVAKSEAAGNTAIAGSLRWKEIR